MISTAIALILLIFSLIATMVISNISSNLYKNIVDMDEGKELQYRRIVVMSLKNAADYVSGSGIGGIPDFSTINFTFSLSKDLVKNPESETFPATILTFPATATLAATSVKTLNGTWDFVELYTRPPEAEEDYGIVVQYLKK